MEASRVTVCRLHLASLVVTVVLGDAGTNGAEDVVTYEGS